MFSFLFPLSLSALAHLLFLNLFSFSLCSIATFMENCYTITFPQCHCVIFFHSSEWDEWRVFQEQKKRHTHPHMHMVTHIEWHNHFRFRWQTVIDRHWLLNWPEYKHTHTQFGALKIAFIICIPIFSLVSNIRCDPFLSVHQKSTIFRKCSLNSSFGFDFFYLLLIELLNEFVE